MYPVPFFRRASNSCDMTCTPGFAVTRIPVRTIGRPN